MNKNLDTKQASTKRCACAEAAAAAAASVQQPVDPKTAGEVPVATAGDADLVWQEENVSMVCTRTVQYTC